MTAVGNTAYNFYNSPSSRRFDADDGCEVLYGRAGLLYALLLIRGAIRVHADSVETSGALPDKLLESLDRLASDDNICVIVKAIIDFGREGAREYAEDIAGSGLIPPPLMWVWHGKRYLGAAHGVAGILQMLWNCPSHIVVPYLTDMLGTLMWLVGQQDKSGNWPTKAPITQGSDTGDNVNELVQYVYKINQVAPDAEGDVSYKDGVTVLLALSFYYPQPFGGRLLHRIIFP